MIATDSVTTPKFTSMGSLRDDGYSFRANSDQFRLRIQPRTLDLASHIQKRNRGLGKPGSLEFLFAEAVEYYYNALAEEGEVPPNP